MNDENNTNQNPDLITTQSDNAGMPIGEKMNDSNPMTDINMNMNGEGSHDHKKIGPLVGSLIIVVLLIAAALYILNERINKETEDTTNITSEVQESSETTNSVLSELPAPIENTEEAVLEAELDAELEGLDNLDF